jgi:hypothetical protein
MQVQSKQQISVSNEAKLLVFGHDESHMLVEIMYVLGCQKLTE